MSVECIHCGNKVHDTDCPNFTYWCITCGSHHSKKQGCRMLPKPMIKTKELKDGGTRVDAGTGGMKEETGMRGRHELISPLARLRLAIHLEKGAKKYEPRNWEKGIKFTRLIQAAQRHIDQFLAGMDDEDHLAAIMCNIMFLMHYEEMITDGELNSSLDDRPNYAKSFLRLLNG